MDKVSTYLSQNIQTLRKKQGLSQERLARNAGIPRSTLTHMESGQGNPSLSNLARIAGALGLGIEELLSRPRSDCQRIAAKDVPVSLRSHGRVKMNKLLPDRLKGIEMDRMELDGEAIMGGHPHLEGTKEYLTVISGEVAVTVAGERFTLKKGDVLAFPGNQPHSYQNPRKQHAVAMSVVIPVPAST